MKETKFRRCHAMAVFPEEDVSFSFESLLAGGTGIRVENSLVVRAAHLDEACTIESAACTFLIACSAEQWKPMPDDEASMALVMELVQKGLLLVDNGEPSLPRDADQRLREGHWWPLSAIHYRHSRWSGVDSVSDMESKQMLTAADLVRKLGGPPEEAPARQAGATPLPEVESGPMEELLARRATCRNFDQSKSLSLELLAQMFQHVLKAQACVETEPGVRFLKKNVPSAGGLHPLEAYVVARNVDGLPRGLYHYHSVAHEMAPVSKQPRDLDAFCERLLAGQSWFASAHVVIVLACRFGRSFWKYRNHAKAYRAVTLDAGHVSQAFYTMATFNGLGAFVTSAINEVEVDGLLGLDPMVEGALAVCGFGWRSTEMSVAELDPAGWVWKGVVPSV